MNSYIKQKIDYWYAIHMAEHEHLLTSQQPCLVGREECDKFWDWVEAQGVPVNDPENVLVCSLEGPRS